MTFIGSTEEEVGTAEAIMGGGKLTGVSSESLAGAGLLERRSDNETDRGTVMDIVVMVEVAMGGMVTTAALFEINTAALPLLASTSSSTTCESPETTGDKTGDEEVESYGNSRQTANPWLTSSLLINV